MYKLSFILTVCLLQVLSLKAQPTVGVHENERQTPYPQEWHTLYINPAPLLVPASMKQSDYLQFNLSRDKKFKSADAILSEPKPWCMFNPHRALKSGTWYWRVRSVSKEGEAMPWSETFTFYVTDEVPQFATPSFEQFLKGIPASRTKTIGLANVSLNKCGCIEIRFAVPKDSLTSFRRLAKQQPDCN